MSAPQRASNAERGSMPWRPPCSCLIQNKTLYSIPYAYFVNHVCSFVSRVKTAESHLHEIYTVTQMSSRWRIQGCYKSWRPSLRWQCWTYAVTILKTVIIHDPKVVVFGDTGCCLDDKVLVTSYDSIKTAFGYQWKTRQTLYHGSFRLSMKAPF